MTDNGRLADWIDKEANGFSGVIHLTQGDEILFERGYGLALRSESIPNRIHTRFQTASGCKIFTSVAVCRMVEQGRLSFDSRLIDCVDAEFPNYAPEVTVHHLLTHSSGITSYFEEDVNPDYEALWTDLPMYRVEGPRDFLPLFQNKPMKFLPGERFDYNDGGYILLGLVLECVTGAGFPGLVSQNVLEPAGMKDSGYFPADQLPERTAYAYIEGRDGTWRTNVFAVPRIGAPDGGAYVTAPDMAAFWRALMAARLLSPEFLGKLLNPHVATSKPAPHAYYGYGVWIDWSEDGVRKYFVEGSDPGVAFRSGFYPNENIVLTMIGNTEHALWPLWTGIEKKLAL